MCESHNLCTCSQSKTYKHVPVHRVGFIYILVFSKIKVSLVPVHL